MRMLSGSIRKNVMALCLWLAVFWVMVPGGALSMDASIAVFRDDLPCDSVTPDPERIGRLLEDCGLAVEFLDATQLSDPGCLSISTHDLLVMPYGSSFPQAAAENLRQFLSDGGKLLTSGGYAFNRPMFQSDGGWIDAEQWAVLNGLPLSTGFEDEDIPARETAPGAFVLVTDSDPHGGRRALRLRCSSEDEPVEARWSTTCEVPSPPRLPMWVNVWVRWEGRSAAPPHVKVALEQFDGDGNRVQRKPLLDSRATYVMGWWRLGAIVPYEKEAETLTLSLTLRGNACWADIDDVAVTRAQDVLMNTHYGIPMPGGMLRVHPLQIGMFDPEFRLTDVASIGPSSHQGVSSASLEWAGDLAGYAAVGKFGNDQVIFGRQWAKWVPVVETYDRFGRKRGPLGAVAYNHTGPYTGSSWGFFGAQDVDVFGIEGGQELLRDTVFALLGSVYAYDMAPEYACYRQGEPIKLSAMLANFGKVEASIDAHLTVVAKDSGEKAIYAASDSLTLSPGATREVAFEFEPEAIPDDVYEARLELFVEGALVDVSRTGFAVWHDDTIAGGLPLSYDDNYFRVGRRPYFLHAVKTPGFIFSNPNESPLNWDDEIALMKACGIDVYEFIQAWPHARKLDDLGAAAKKLLRQLDALAVITQRHRVVMKPSIFDGVNPGAGDDELPKQLEWTRLLGARYRDVPGLSYDIQGDIPLTIWKVPLVERLFNEWLASSYGTTEALRAAWVATPPKGELPHVELNVQTTGKWDDAKVRDLELFKTSLLLRWTRAVTDALSDAGADAPICAEFLPNLDQAGGSRDLDYSTLCGYYKDDAFPGGFASTDLRVVGKSLGLNEYGVSYHPAHGGNRHTYRLPEQHIAFYLNIGHYILGLGGSVNLVWDWKDNIEVEFPWGLAHKCTVLPKPKLLAYRDMSLLFRMFDLKYEPAELYFVVPDSNRSGPLEFWEFDPILSAGIDALLALHVPFGVVHEMHLDSLPDSTRALVWPIPFFPPDQAVARVEELVKNGCALYVSGDFSFDEQRRRSRISHLERLAGVRFLAARYPYIHAPSDSTIELEPTQDAWSTDAAAPCIDIEPTTATVVLKDTDGRPVAVTNALGKGKVFYTTDIPEVLSRERTQTLYRDFLAWAGLAAFPDVGGAANCDVMRIPLTDGGTVHVFLNRSWEDELLELETRAGTVRMLVAPRRPAVVAVSAAGELFAIECERDVTLDGRPLVGATGQVMLAALDRKGLPTSEALLVMPIDACRTSLVRTTAGLDVETGQIERGKWRAFARVHSTREPAGMVPLHAEDSVLELLIAAPPGALANARRLLEKWVMQPDSVPVPFAR